ncbi:MAG: adenine phosphoribosyltransferase [Spirochaetales bacterium]|nr:adenine phosphoribosyltransferase [Spirochaetales bacterium]
MDLDKVIRKVPDFPAKGILFYDITSVIGNPKAFTYCIDRMVELYKDKKIDAVAGVESRGFIFAAPFAEKMGIPLILIRKAGKLPGTTLKAAYSLEYGKAEIEVHQADVPENGNILLIDDLLATGGTLEASARILRDGGARVENIFGVIGLPFLGFREKLKGIEVTTLIDYDSE